jgi:hypothetical protein
MNNPITILNCKNAIRKRNNPKFSRPVAKIRNGEIIKIYPSMREAQRDGFNEGRIWLVCNGKAHTHAGCFWKYV